MTLPGEAVEVLRIVREVLADSLMAVYLHGSAVAGGLRPTSDVDLLVVSERPMPRRARKHLVAELLRSSGPPGSGSSRRPVELMVFRSTDLTAPAYPARCDFLYGEWLRQDLEAGRVPGPLRDPEFTLVLAQARSEALALAGPDPGLLLPTIPAADIRRAIGDVLPTLLASLAGDERNVLLTLARMWRTLAIGDFVPKDAAALWASARLPAEPAALLAAARDAYLGASDIDWQARRRELQQTVAALHEHVRACL